MTASRPSSLEIWPTGTGGTKLDGSEELRTLKARSDQFRALLDSLGKSLNRLQSQEENYDNKQTKYEITHALQLLQEIPDYIDEFVDLATEYAISVHGSGMQMEDDGTLHHAYSISSRQLALQLIDAKKKLERSISDWSIWAQGASGGYNGSRGRGWYDDFAKITNLIHNIRIGDPLGRLHSGAYFTFYVKEVDKHYQHCIQQIAGATSFSRWVNNHNKSAKASNTPLIRFVNFVIDEKSDEESRRAFADWMLDEQTTAREIAILDTECKKFLIRIMGSQLGDLRKDKIIALAEGGMSDLSMPMDDVRGEMSSEGEILFQLHSALSKHMYETMRLGAPLDNVSKKFLDTTLERESWDASYAYNPQKKVILWGKYKNTGMLRALAQNAKLDLAYLFDSTKDRLPWVYLEDPSVIRYTNVGCFNSSDWPFNLGFATEEIMKKINSYLDDIIADTHNKELDFKNPYSNKDMMDSFFRLLTDERTRAIFKSKFACVMIRSEATKFMQQAASGLTSKYDYFRLIATMISFFSPMGKWAGETASKYIGQFMAGSLHGTSLGELIQRVSQGGASMSLRGDQIRVSDGNIVFYLPTQDEGEE